MPICLRSVEPSQLSRGINDYIRFNESNAENEDEEECLNLGSALDRDKISLTVANSTLSKAVLQLVSLLQHADDIFSDLSDQCRLVQDRTIRVNKRIIRIAENVENLNSKDEPIPSGDLKHFHEGVEPFDAKHGFDCNLFTSETRPKCVRDLYSTAEVSPSVGLSNLDGIRKDGWSGSTMFKLWPIAIKDITISTPDFNMCRKSYSVSNSRYMTRGCGWVSPKFQHGPPQFNKSYKTLKEPHRSQTVHSFDQLNFDLDDEEESASHCEEQRRLSQSQPSILVSIDTSGAGFDRMCLFRRSLRELQSGSTLSPSSSSLASSRCTRRRSISGLPESIMQEVRDFETRKRNSDKHYQRPRRHPRTYSFNDIGPAEGKDETFAKYFDEVEGRMEERNELEHLSKQSFFSKFMSCHRSRSLPRCAKAKYQRIDRASRLSERRSIHIDTSEPFSLDDGLSMTSGSFRRYQKRSSLIGDKLKNLIGGSHRPQRQSLNLDLFKTPLTSKEGLNEASTSLAKTLSMPEGISETEPQMDTAEKTAEQKSGQYYSFSNNTLPRAQAKKYDFPWESLPKDWTTSVRLREMSKRRKEERQSSSGNWSGSTSARQSLESNQTSCPTPTNPMTAVLCSASYHSLGQDSGRDSATETDERQTSDTPEEAGDETSTLTGDPSDKDTHPNNFTRLDTVTWLKNLAIRACNQDDTSSSSMDSLSRLTKPDFLSFDLLSSSSGMKAPGLLDDEVSSIYSLDQDGFYTSFHSDSGLKRSSMIVGQNVEEEEEVSPESTSIGSSVTVDSVVYIPGSKCIRRLSTDSGRDQTTPTREMSDFSSRSCSVSPTGSEGSDSTLTNVSKRTSTASATTESSYSETDHEIIYKRLRNKTLISPTTFPSWCAVSSSGSDEDVNQQRLKAEFMEQQELNKTLKMADILYREPLALYMESSTLEKSTSEGKQGRDGTENTQAGKPKSQALGGDDEGSTLPRSYLASKKWNDEDTDQTGSWPRTYSNWKENKTQGILKSSFRKESVSGPKTPKSLNFAPYVNMVEPGKMLTQQCLLSDLSSTGGSYSSMPETNSFSSSNNATSETNYAQSYKCANVPIAFIDSEETEQTDTHTEPSTDNLYQIKPLLPESFKTETPKANTNADNSSYSSLNQPSENVELRGTCTIPGSTKDSVLVKRPEPVSAKKAHPPTNYEGDENSQLFNPLITIPSGKPISTFRADSTTTSSTNNTDSSPYAISQVSRDPNQGKNTSMSFKISKPIVQKSSDTETVVISTSKSHPNSVSATAGYSCTAPAPPKRISTFLTQVTPESTPERPSERGPTLSSTEDHCSPKNSPVTPKYSSSDPQQDRAIPSNVTAETKANPNTRNQSYRVAVTEEVKEEPKRLDSYRKAILLSNKIVEDLPNRSDSYRVAMEGCLSNCNSLDDTTSRSDSYRVAIRRSSDEEPLSQFCPIMGPSPVKDPRRMGITDIEQLTGSTEDLFKNCLEKSPKSTSLFTKMFGSGSKSDSSLRKANSKNNGMEPTDKSKKQTGRRHSQGRSETGLQEFKKLVAQHSTPASPKISAVEALKKKPTPPNTKETPSSSSSSSESGTKKIFGNFFQRPSSWGGTDKVNPKMSTYVSFDTIFEDKESISSASSIESLRSPSLNSIKKIGDTENLCLVKMNNGLKSDRKSLIDANKNLTREELKASKRRLGSPVDERAVQSVLDSIKTTIKSMTSRTDSSYKSQCGTGV